MAIERWSEVMMVNGNVVGTRRLEGWAHPIRGSIIYQHMMYVNSKMDRFGVVLGLSS